MGGEGEGIFGSLADREKDVALIFRKL